MGFDLGMVLRLRPWLVPVNVLGAGLAIAACMGTIGDGAGGSAGGGGGGSGAAGGGAGGLGAAAAMTEAACAKITVPSPGATPLRRLTQPEYDATIRDLLGDSSNPATAFPPDQRQGDFSNTAVALTVSPLLAQGYESAAEQLATTAIGHLGTIAPCDTATTGEDACAAQFVQTFGKRAFRRPLTADEQSGLVALYTANRSGADYNNGIQSVIEAILQSAPFLYRPEFGATARAQGAVLPLTSYEMASRLSYFLWGSMPDATLFAAADADTLQTPQQVSAQATRMLADPKAHPAITQFFSEWLGVDEIANAPKDPTAYAQYTPQVRDAMQAETSAFADWVMWQSDAKLATLLTAPVSFVNQTLAPIYGLAGVTGSAMQMVALDPTQRAGIVTQAALMTVLGKADRSSPVLRGKFVREKFFCQAVAPPPQNIVITPPPVMPGVSTREMFTMHSTVEPCKSCHTLMDPIGFGFENYDGIGQWRTTDQGQTVNASGTVSGTDVDGTFDGAVDLAHKLSESPDVRDCVATEWFRYAMGRGEATPDTCALQSLKDSFAGTQADIRQLLVAVTQTDTFRYRMAVTP
jgi:Protein of unknown function (DUF1592)/Protein of unknown function (DUF1588)/Protein of unknown function (DUF1587)/Protein of unknown function (DUF1595)/Protein of unknown function (DUF1585)